MKMTEIKKYLKVDKFNPARIIIIFTIVIFSCNSKVVFENYHQLKGSEWPQDSILKFRIDIIDSTKIYNLSLNVRNEGRYPFSNLWLFISIMPPAGIELKDTVELTLANPDGKWFGSGLGDLYEKKYPYKQNIFFPRKGNYTIQVRQGMRTENEILKGIHDFGICLEKAF
jgi:gliding motility-associated lipoprotein GldH